MLNILFIADVVGSPGRKVVKALLPGLRKRHEIGLYKSALEIDVMKRVKRALDPAQPKGTCGLGTDGEISRRVSPEAPYPASLAECAVRRQTPKVGAVCGNSARTDLCGGRSEMGVPTANQ